VIDRLLHEIVRPRCLGTLRRHDTVLAGEAFDRMLVESRLALRYARSPGALVSRLRRACDAGTVTGGAAELVRGLAVGRQFDLDLGAGCLDRQRGIVLAGDGHRRDWLEPALDARDVSRIGRHLRELVLFADVTREREQPECDGKQDAEHEAEIIEEMGVLFAHGRGVYL
jgi:hypothetical protein